jgi:hypothetical protein
MSGIGLPKDRTETHRFETPFYFTQPLSIFSIAERLSSATAC